MRRVVTAILVLLGSSAFAAHDAGVEIDIDEFTGERSCSQIVVNSPFDFSGISLATSSQLPGTHILFIRSIDTISESVFNMFGVMPADRVYVRFPATEEVFEFKPMSTSVESSYEVAVVTDGVLANRIMASPSDLRVRFSGSDGNGDFTVNHDVIVALASGFGKECL